MLIRLSESVYIAELWWYTFFVRWMS